MTSCDREELVLDILRSGRAIADTDLAPHLAACDRCADLAEVAAAVLDEQRVATLEAQPPASGIVWWRMQRRAQREAMRKAARAVTAVQALSIVGALIVAVSILGLTTLKSLAATISIPDATSLAPWSVPLAMAVAACLAVAPVAVYLSLARD